MDKVHTDFQDSTYPAFLTGRYQSITRIGEGGMGAVYKALDKHLDKEVVIKVIKSESNYEKHAVDFQKEAKALSKLKHDNLVTCLDFGVGEGELLYMVLEYVEGKTLAEEIQKKGRLPIEQVLEVAFQICKGLSHAHGNKILHRDLKPENVLISNDENGDLKVTIIDFGIAKQVEADGGDGDGDGGEVGATATRDGIIKGSPFYMAPEIINGKIATPASDIYSFGCLLFKCLTGRVPFEGDNLLVTLEQHLNESAPNILIERKDCPEELANLVKKCLEKSPDRRPGSASHLSNQIMEIRNPKPIAGLEEILENDKKKASSYSLILISGTAIALTFFLISGFSLFLTWAFTTYDNIYQKKHVALKEAVPAPKPKTELFRESIKLNREVWKPASHDINDEDLAELIETKPPRGLYLALTSINGSGLKNYAKWHTSFVNVSDTAVNDEGVKNICTNKNLTYLDISYTEATNDCIKYLVTLPNLKHIELSGCRNIDHNGIIEFLKNRPPHLFSVKIKTMRLGSEVVPYIVSAGPTHLEIADNYFTDDDLIEIAKIPGLYNLDISGLREITDRSFKVVAALKDISELECRNIDGVSKNLILKTTKEFESKGKTIATSFNAHD